MVPARLGVRRLSLAGFGALALEATAEPQPGDPRFEVGLRYAIVTAGGEPTNDMMAAGVYGLYRLRPRWLIGIGLDSWTGDFERPYELVGLSSTEEVDSTLDSLTVTGWVTREYGSSPRLRWFWSAGLGFGSPDVDDVTGPLEGGGSFDIATDAGSEILVCASGGLRWNLGRFRLEAAVRADHHVADWTIVDRTSGLTGTVDDYTAVGAHVGLALRF